MNSKTILSDHLDACYAVARLTDSANDYLLVASETENACLAYDVNRDFARTVVWSEVGGTMSIIQVPGTLDFLATQRFYPGFDAKDCRIVHGQFESEGKWTITEVGAFPYLHRFDLVDNERGAILFIGCTIANSKQFVEDWSDDGKIFVGYFDKQLRQLTNVEELPLRLKKNHGYYPVHAEHYSLITAVEGIYRLVYPQGVSDWTLTQLFDEETSDIVQLDMDGDGRLENMIIQAFHGDSLRILSEDFKEELFAYPEATPFGHAIWSGTLLGQPTFVFGWRSGKKHLLAFTYENGRFLEHMIAPEVASSNCLAFEKAGKSYIFSANNGKNTVALYELQKEEKNA